VVLKEYQVHISAGAPVFIAYGHHVLCGPAVVPAGCAPVSVQAVLEGVDVDVSVTTNVVSMETAALTMMRSVVEEVEAACLIKTS
jgi:hypothetical protein